MKETDSKAIAKANAFPWIAALALCGVCLSVTAPAAAKDDPKVISGDQVPTLWNSSTTLGVQVVYNSWDAPAVTANLPLQAKFNNLKSGDITFSLPVYLKNIVRKTDNHAYSPDLGVVLAPGSNIAFTLKFGCQVGYRTTIKIGPGAQGNSTTITSGTVAYHQSVQAQPKLLTQTWRAWLPSEKLIVVENWKDALRGGIPASVAQNSYILTVVVEPIKSLHFPSGLSLKVPVVADPPALVAMAGVDEGHGTLDIGVDRSYVGKGEDSGIKRGSYDSIEVDASKAKQIQFLVLVANDKQIENWQVNNPSQQNTGL